MERIFALVWLTVVTTCRLSQCIEHEDCHGPLGMKNGRISDSQITASHWLYFTHTPQTQHYQALYARLDLKSSSGAWCSDSMSEHSEQYLQIDLRVNVKITGVATQGRWGGAEYTEAYQITYQRDQEKKFRKYKEDSSWKTFVGNNNNATTMRRNFKYPIITRKLRIYPRGREFTIYCLRLELYGCKWTHRKHGVRSYSAPVGTSYMGIDTQDFDSYDGNVSLADNFVNGGLGKLTDDVYGKNRLHFDRSDTSAWVAYNNPTPVVTLRLHRRRVVRKVMIHVLDNGQDIRNFRHLLISARTHNGSFKKVKEYSLSREKLKKRGPHPIVINVGDVFTKTVRLTFIKEGDLLLVSEIYLVTDDHPSERELPIPARPPTVPTLVYDTPLEIVDEEVKMIRSENEEMNMDGSGESLSFPIIITITLMSSALFMLISILVYKTFVTKKPPPAVTSLAPTGAQIPVTSHMVATGKQVLPLLYDHSTVSYKESKQHQHQEQQQQKQQRKQQQQHQQHSNILRYAPPYLNREPSMDKMSDNYAV